MAGAKTRKSPGPDGLPLLMRRLPFKRQEVIRPVLERPREHVLLSLRDMAETLHSAPATLLRIIRDLGFPSYYDFRQYLHDQDLTHATTLDTGESNPRDFGHASFNQDTKNLQILRTTLDWKRVIGVAKRMYRARRILIIGGDRAAYLAGLLDYEMSLLGLNSVAAVSTGEILHRTRYLAREDLVIAISFRRGLKQTVEGLKLARAKGAYCVGITDTLASPIARHANEYFLACTEGVSIVQSYVAPTVLINLLMAECANQHRTRTVSLLKETAKEQQNGFRWYVPS
jgi:RpiR family carbohydrate utilization transcriptional regulator